MSDNNSNVVIEKNGITIAKINEEGDMVDGLTEQILNEKQKKSVRQLVHIV